MAIGLASILTVNAQLAVDNSITAEDLVQNVLLGAGVTVSNITFNGVPGNVANIQIGSFNGSNSNLGLSDGVIMASGNAEVAIGPNADVGATEPPAGLNSPGDDDLSQLLDGSITNDAAILEFDFVPNGDSLSFNFVFSSEEYNEYVCGTWNDVFGFFLSGPGISGPYSNNARNIALIPGTTIPVQINTVNNGTVGLNGYEQNCIDADPNWQNNSQYFIDNNGGSTIEMDGLTQVLTAQSVVQCGETYHIKIAISDVFDAVFDSAVFLEAGSFSSPNAIVVEATTVSGDNQLIEGCEDAQFTFSRPGTSGDQVIRYILGGNAENGTDYVWLPDSIVIPDGSNSNFLTMSAIQDNMDEGTDTLTIFVFIVNVCGDTTISEASILINDYPELIPQVENLITDCTQDSVMISAGAVGGVPGYTYQWDDGTINPDRWVNGMASGTYTVTITDECPALQMAALNVVSNCDVFVPNVFTPNGDGLNDTFVIEGIDFVNNTLKVFNRWGQVVYETKNYRSNWRADDVADGTYFYVLEVNGHNDPYTGHVTILANGN